MIADLHSHTTCSDGYTPPRELVRLAKAGGVEVLAVTDHDTVEALPECLDEARAQGLRVLPGIEMSAIFEGADVHVLGYGIDHAAPDLQGTLGGLLEKRRSRVSAICVKLGVLGVTLDPKEVLEEAGGKSVGRRHVARVMVKKGIVASLSEAFSRFLGTDSPANVPAGEMSPAEAATFIRRHGGLAVLAHPGFLEDDPKVERVLDTAPGIRGIEVFHRYRSPRRHLRYLEMARKRDLVITGGSDFHGDRNPRNAALGSMIYPSAHWKDFEKRLRAL
jgi:predicted metal-dependent phosphoesterase TrpH